MTGPEDILKFIDRAGYERACAEAGTRPMSDPEASKLAETGYERLHELVVSGASLTEKAVLATHLRRGWSVLAIG